jgi:hypothetical protein
MIPESCPKCLVSFQGNPIPEKERHLFGNAEHFSRVLGISCLQRDRIVFWKCPDCGHEWPRVYPE